MKLNASQSESHELPDQCLIARVVVGSDDLARVHKLGGQMEQDERKDETPITNEQAQALVDSGEATPGPETTAQGDGDPGTPEPVKDETEGAAV